MITIVVPTFNEIKNISRIINQLLALDLSSDIEIIIVDDGCPEKSGHLAKKIAKGNKNIKVIFHQKN